jgi:predicted small lipoprotein YifL
MVALALAGCGRKGPLDLPPTAYAPTASAAPGATDTPAAAKPSLFDPSYGSNAAPTAPRGKKQPFVLDPLLGN